MKHRVLITAGGTGGHIFPGVALAHYLRDKGWDVEWMGVSGGMEEEIVARAQLPFKGVNFRGIRGKGIIHAVKGGVSMVKAILQAADWIGHKRPDVVVGFGGYPTMPALIAARLLRIPVVLHEANRILGLANRMAARWAVRVAVSFPNTEIKGVPRHERQVVYTGAPLRTAFGCVDTPKLRYLERRGPLRILVVGGSQGAVALNTLVPAAIAKIPLEERPFVRHQAGKHNIDALIELYKKHQVEAECVSFIEDILHAYLDADVVICRAGALTVAELLAVGVPALYVPLPYAKDQPANAKWCEEQGAGWYVAQESLTPGNLASYIRGWNREELLLRAKTAYQLGIRDGTERLADLCEQVLIKNK